MEIKTLFSAVLLHTAFLFPTTYTWVPTGSGSWSTSGNWSPSGPPTLAGDVATFSTSITSPATVTVDQASFIVGTLSFTNTSNAYTLTASSTNSLALQGTSGTTAITNGSSVTSNNVISNPLVVVNALTITQSSTTNTLTIAGAMSGAASVTTAGAGTTVFSGLNTYTGGTTVTAGELDCNTTATLPAAGALTISGGTVKCNAVNVLPSSGTLTLSGGTLNLNSLNQNTGPITGTTTITLGTAILTSTTAATTSYSGTINGAGGFTLAGSGGVFTFSTAQPYTGGTIVNGSTLQVGLTNGLLTTGNLTVNSPGTFNLANFNQTVAVLAGSGRITLGSGTLTTTTATNSTFSGSISGTGSFVQAGSSTLTLTGVSSYTGGTTISAGELQLGINNALALTGPVSVTGILDMTPAASTLQAIGPLSGTGNVNLGATHLTINSTTSSSYSGVMNGTGSLTIAGPQTLTVTHNNTYSGGTTVTGGTLALGITNGLLPTGNLAVNSPGLFNLANFNQTVGILSGNGTIVLGSGTLTVNTPANMTSNFSGVISQSGTLDVGSTGTLFLTGPNSYSGGTVVSAGANLQGNTISLQGVISNSGSLIFDQSSPGTFSGTLTGTGTLIVSGVGVLTLTGAPTQGNTLVNTGELILNHATLTSPVTVSSGASLGAAGSSTIIGATAVNGILALGLGNLQVTGNYSQSPTSIFDLAVTPSASGLLNVTGMFTLESQPAIDISIEPGAYAASTTYTFVTAGSTAGTFAPPVFENPFFDGSIIYNPTSLQLILNIAPFSNVIQGGNAGAIAKCINLQAFPAESQILPIIQTLVFLPVKEVRDILDEIQPSQLKALGLTEENNLLIIRSTISQRLDDLYKTECNQALAELSTWNIWGSLSGDFLRQEGQGENIGYAADTAGATFGTDVALAKNLFLGVATAYDYSWLTWTDAGGDASISSLYLGPYFSWFNRRLFTNLSFLGTFNQYQASRHISFPTTDVHAKSRHHGYGLLARFDLGIMLYPTAGMSCTPIAGLDYIHLWEGPSTEHGAGGLDMKIHATQASLFRTELGLQIAKCAILTHNKWTHDLKLSWIHQFSQGTHLQAQFKEVDCTYTVQGLKPVPDYLDIATGLTGIFMKDKLSAALRYEGKFGDGIRDNTGYVQLTYRF